MYSGDVYGTSDPMEYYHHAHELEARGDYKRAIAHYEKAIALDPERLDAEVYAFAAWLLATCPDQNLRNGERAVKFATEACEITEWGESWPLSILAAAYTQAGDVKRAIETQAKACSMADATELADCVDQLNILKKGAPLLYHSIFSYAANGDSATGQNALRGSPPPQGILPSPLQPGLLRICPACRRWFALRLNRSQSDTDNVRTFRCRYCGVEARFAKRHPPKAV